MPKLSDEELFALRAQKIEGWLEVYDHLDDWLEDELLSRQESAGALSGFGEPRWASYVCGWCGGKDCDRCRQSRIDWATEFDQHDLITKQRGRIWVKESDPYAHGAKSDGVRLIESDSSRRARSAAKLDADIATLERYALIRAGIESNEDRDTRILRLMRDRMRGARDLLKVLQALRSLLRLDTTALKRPREVLARALAHLVTGELRWPPALALTRGG